MTEAVGYTTTDSLTNSIITDSCHIKVSPKISHKRMQYKVPIIQVHEYSRKGEHPTVEDTALDVSIDLNGTETIEQNLVCIPATQLP